ncbi:hypothetical protein SLEP1_g32938 [Rubroshorea leprosula]|uniref:Uncharacterized protein n=1 Tax=Rubroshorea leprosula TaxID=152421 RepID=A0AAV5KF19_9ROSI|nr:hypothetical protein SLEP1_g32938 [Rubroshorea leprosula]
MNSSPGCSFSSMSFCPRTRQFKRRRICSLQTVDEVHSPIGDSAMPISSLVVRFEPGSRFVVCNFLKILTLQIRSDLALISVLYTGSNRREKR